MVSVSACVSPPMLYILDIDNSFKTEHDALNINQKKPIFLGGGVVKKVIYLFFQDLIYIL